MVNTAEVYKALYTKLRGQYLELNNKILKNALNIQVLKKALLELILIQNLSFQLIKTKEF